MLIEVPITNFGFIEQMKADHYVLFFKEATHILLGENMYKKLISELADSFPVTLMGGAFEKVAGLEIIHVSNSPGMCRVVYLGPLC